VLQRIARRIDRRGRSRREGSKVEGLLPGHGLFGRGETAGLELSRREVFRKITKHLSVYHAAYRESLQKLPRHGRPGWNGTWRKRWLDLFHRSVGRRHTVIGNVRGWARQNCGGDLKSQESKREEK